MKKRSKQNNPEQKTRNGINNEDMELGREYDPVKQLKKSNSKKSQPVRSKQHIENPD
ncbi:glycogen biosynthesis protein GlgD [Heyndrickxia camelliae]|uniref:Glycogen biosynthesis protein GlgD n=1 Tax=Heyndrickxia camelliae TaxID=1707093 RepID=A0A2N3LIB9_9BACI|nr:glycogen biosynthesis protein GlgD [Heyndrickxia camelliae]PKR84361.1 glycogen biosynthesis protein GlgD [Heyndrickxia camelliae]